MKYGYDIPVEDRMIDEITNFCERAKEYLSKIKIGDTPILMHGRRTGFLGLTIALENLIPLYQTLKPYGLRYLLTYKLNQDHLETWFSAVRSKGGFNNNPNCEQFKSIFKKLLIHHELRTGAGNCVSNDINILDVPSTKKKLRESQQVNEELLNVSNEDNLISEDIIEKFKVDEANVGYAAGFICHRILERKQLASLKAQSPEGSNLDLINLKNRGKLTVPSEDICKFCSAIEKRVRNQENKLLNARLIPTLQNEILCDIEEEFSGVLDPLLMDVIIKIYFKLKIHRLCKRVSEVDKNIRHTSKKMTIYLHQ